MIYTCNELEQREPAGLAGNALVAPGIQNTKLQSNKTTPKRRRDRKEGEGQVSDGPPRCPTPPFPPPWYIPLSGAHIHLSLSSYNRSNRSSPQASRVAHSPARVPPMPLHPKETVPPKVSSEVAVLLLVQAPHQARLAALLAQFEHAESLTHAASLRQPRRAFGG